MERGKPDQDIYTFELPEGQHLAYPDAELWTRDYGEARSYAQERGYQVITNHYEFADSELEDDFTPDTEDEDEPGELDYEEMREGTPPPWADQDDSPAEPDETPR